MVGGRPHAGDPPALDEPVALDDPAVIYTPGTTGRPKGGDQPRQHVELRQRSSTPTWRPTRRRSSAHRCSTWPRWNMVAMPLVMKGGTLLTGQFDPAVALAPIERHGVTGRVRRAPPCSTPWPRARRSGRRPVEPAPPAVRRGAGAAVDHPHLPRPRRPVPAGLRHDRDRLGARCSSALAAADKAGTAGVPSFFTDVRGSGPTARTLRRARRARWWWPGPTMLGYWNRPDATAEVMDGEWFRSGDVAVVDDEGTSRSSTG